MVPSNGTAGEKDRQMSKGLALGTAWVLVVAVITPVIAQSTSIGVNFRATHRGGGESTSIPPDTMGAVGPDHVMLLVNGRYELYTKNPIINGEDGQPLPGEASGLTEFWRNTVGVNGHSFAFDPRVTYDPFSQRWYAVSVDGQRRADSGYLFAISKSANPTDGWDGFRWLADSAGRQWADFPMLGFDGDYVYISSNHLPVVNSGSSNVLHAIPKSDLFSTVPSIDNRQTFLLDPTTNQVVVALDDLGPAEQPYHLWEEGSTNVSIDQVTADDSMLNVATNAATVGLGGFLSAPTNARQPDGSSNLDVDNDRISSRLVRVNGSYWGVYLRRSNSIGGARPNILRWFEIDAAALALNPAQALKQEGTIGLGTPGVDDQDPHYPSIAVNDHGDVVIGFSGSGPSEAQFPSAYAVVGHTDNGTTMFGSPIGLKSGTASYQRLSSGRSNRWGDYSNTVTDPSDPNIFWTFQEWAGSDDNWNVQATELITYEANEFYWSRASDSTFQTGGSWLPGSRPGPDDSAIFSRSGDPYTVRFNRTDLNRSLSIRQGTVTFNLDGNGYFLTSTDPSEPALVVGPANGSPSLNLTGGVFYTPNAWIGPGRGATASVAVTGSGTSWIVSGSAYVGGNRTGPGGVAIITAEDHGTVLINDTLQIYNGSSAIASGGSFTLGDSVLQTPPGALWVHPDGTIQGAGFVLGDVLNHGTIAPGQPEGILVIDGSYAQEDGGILEIELGGPTLGDDFDHLALTGDASLNGVLEVSLVNDFLPNENDLFNILSTSDGTITGTFSIHAAQPADRVFNVGAIYTPTSVTLEVVDLVLLADVNADGMINNLDILPFLIAMDADDEEDEFISKVPGGLFFAADINRDLLVNELDINPFIDIFEDATGNPPPLSALVPEPSAVFWLAVCGAMLWRRYGDRKRHCGQFDQHLSHQ